MVFNFTFSLAQFPSYYYDEGVYISRAIAFSTRMELYDSPTYIDHPPLGWIILSFFFRTIDFPNSLTADENAESLSSNQIELLFLIPRLFGLPFLLASGVLTYKIARILYSGSRKYSVMALVAFATIPAFWPFRSVLIDPLMMFFLLVSLYILTSKAIWQNAPTETLSKSNFREQNPARSSRFAYIAISGSLFAIAFLMKFTAIFFAPAFLILLLFEKPRAVFLVPSTTSPGMAKPEENSVNSSRARVENGFVVGLLKVSFWAVPILLGIFLWLLSLIASGYKIEDLIATQHWQITRPSAFPSGIALFFLLAIIPLGLIFSIAGLAQQLRDKCARKWTILTIPYFAFLLRGGTIGFSHIIPLTPFLSILAGKPLWNMLRRIISILRFRSIGPEKESLWEPLILNYVVPIFMVLSILVTVWIVSFDASRPDREAIMYLVKSLPANSTLVADQQYHWILNVYRPDVKVVDYYTLNYLHPAPIEFYFAEKTNVRSYDSGLPQSETMLKNSCLVDEFVNRPEGLHPLSLIPDSLEWWNVQIRQHSAIGCRSQQ